LSKHPVDAYLKLEQRLSIGHKLLVDIQKDLMDRGDDRVVNLSNGLWLRLSGFIGAVGQVDITKVTNPDIQAKYGKILNEEFERRKK